MSGSRKTLPSSNSATHRALFRSSRKQAAVADEFGLTESFQYSLARYSGQKFKDSFIYDAEATEIIDATLDFSKHRRGVCQAFAHLLVSLSPPAGITPADVSGYLLTSHRPENRDSWRGCHARVGSRPHPPAPDDRYDPRMRVLLATGISSWPGADFSDVSPVKGCSAEALTSLRLKLQSSRRDGVQ